MNRKNDISCGFMLKRPEHEKFEVEQSGGDKFSEIS